MQDSYSTAVRRAQDYNVKFIEYAQTNTEAVFEFVRQLGCVHNLRSEIQNGRATAAKKCPLLAQSGHELTPQKESAFAQVDVRHWSLGSSGLLGG